MSNEANNDPISSAMGLVPMNNTSNVVANLEASMTDDKVDADFNFARNNIRTVIEDSIVAISKLGEIADQSQHPRAYEVLARVMEISLQGNKDLMEIHKNKSDIEVANGTKGGDKRVTNNLFVGSTEELKNLLEGLKKPSEDECQSY